MPARLPASAALGRAIRSLRHARKQSQEEVASEAGIDVTYLRGIELGKRNPSWEIVAQIAAAFDIPLADLAARAERERSAKGR